MPIAASRMVTFSAAPLDLQLRQRPRQRRVHRRDLLVRDLFAQPRRGALPRLLDHRFVDLLGLDRHVGDDRHARGGDLHQPLADGERPVDAVLRHDDLARDDLRDQAHVMRVDADLSFDGRQGHHVDVLGERGRLRRDDFESQVSRHDGPA